MKKIKSLFERNHDGDRQVRNEVVPGCEWVLEGEGKATKKLDGTACMLKGRESWGRLRRKEKIKK